MDKWCRDDMFCLKCGCPVQWDENSYPASKNNWHDRICESCWNKIIARKTVNLLKDVNHNVKE